MTLILPGAVQDLNLSSILTYIQDNASEKRKNIKDGSPRTDEGEEGVPFFRLEKTDDREHLAMYIRHKGRLYSMKLQVNGAGE